MSKGRFRTECLLGIVGFVLFNIVFISCTKTKVIFVDGNFAYAIIPLMVLLVVFLWFVDKWYQKKAEKKDLYDRAIIWMIYTANLLSTGSMIRHERGKSLLNTSEGHGFLKAFTILYLCFLVIMWVFQAFKIGKRFVNQKEQG